MRRLVLIALLAAGCGGDSGGPIPIDDLDSAAINVFCSFYVSCGLIEDQATCRSLNLDINIDADLIAAVKAGKVHYDPDKARQCLDGATLTCDRVGFNRSDTNNSSACDDTFTGTVAAGGQCALDEECISKQCDIPGCGMACCQGTCVGDAPLPRPKAGEACGTNQPSWENSYCDYTAMLCVAYKANGEACTSSGQCAAGTCTNQVCTALVANGGACTSGGTTSSQCANIGYYCSATTSTCTAYGLTGDACTGNAECSPIYQCTSGACELRPTLGDACSTTTGTSCVDHSYCEPTTMKCTAPKADNSPCMSDSECESRNCDSTSNTCLTPPVCI